MVGEQTELAALRACGLDRAHLNATKSLVGHALSAAGMVELIDAGLRWVGATAIDHGIERALNMSMGFGGINTAICLQRG